MKCSLRWQLETPVRVPNFILCCSSLRSALRSAAGDGGALKGIGEGSAAAAVENLLPRLLNLASKVWLRLTSPSGMRLLAPLLAIALVYLGWRLWRLAGRSPLGLAVRWWVFGLALAGFATGVLYGVAGPPADPELRAVLRETAGQKGRAPLPAPLALLGAIAVAGASLLAAWRWRLAPRSGGRRKP